MRPSLLPLARMSLVFVIVISANGIAASAPRSGPPALPTPPHASQPPKVDKVPLVFVENGGQTDPQVAFTVQGSDKTVYFTETGLTLVLAQKPKASARRSGFAGHAAPPSAGTPGAGDPAQAWALKLDFVGARAVRASGVDPTPALVSYLKGQPADWHAALHSYAGISYSEPWPGIDLTYRGAPDRLKYAFTLRPGADPARIRLAYRSATSLWLDSAGQLHVGTPLGELVDAAPTAYQEIEGQQVPVAGAYELKDNTISFRLGAYNPAYPLVIDPAVLVYAGFIGGTDADTGYGIALDYTGAVYIAGTTYSTDFPAQGGPFLTLGGTLDAFVAKVKPDGSGLVYATYLGGAGDDEGRAISVDGTGAAYVAGASTSWIFPQWGVLRPYSRGNWDAFVVKLRPDGTDMVYGGLLGGSGIDWASGIAVDNAGAAIVVGGTESANFPIVDGPSTHFHGSTDAFVARIEVKGEAFIYCGYLGGISIDYAWGVAVDGSGAAYVTGWTFSTDFPVAGTFGPTDHGYYDAFVTKVKPDGSGLVYSGFVGGSGEERANGIAVDASGAAYITGYSNSTDFPAYGRIPSGNDVFAAKVNPDGSALAYVSRFGGSDDDEGASIAVNGQTGAAYITGRTRSTDFPVVNPLYASLGGDWDAFVAEIGAVGSGPVFASYLGGSALDQGTGIAVDASGAAIVTGFTASGDFPVLGGPKTTLSGIWYDAFVAKLFPGTSYTVTGQVTTSNGKPLPGAHLRDERGYSVQTGADGRYAYRTLYGGDHTLTAAKRGYTFPISSTQVTLTGPDVTDVNFTADLPGWTLAFYMSGDNDLTTSYGPILGRIEGGIPDAGMNVTALRDELGPGQSIYYWVKPSKLKVGGGYVSGEDTWPKGELDLGDPDTLVDFLNWTMDNFPASHYAVILDDHGAGIGGALIDHTPAYDVLSLKEIKLALNTVVTAHQKIDVLVMNACLMGPVELGYQFRDSINYYVASEELQWVYFPGYTQSISATTTLSTPLQVATAFVDGYADDILARNGQLNRNDFYTMSAADISQVQALKTAVDNLSLLLDADLTQSGSGRFDHVLSEVQKFKYDLSDPHVRYIDLWDFGRLVNQEYADQSIKDAAQALMTAVAGNYIVHNRSSYTNAGGVSIFAPYQSASYYNGDNVDYAAGTAWVSPGMPASARPADMISASGGWGNLMAHYIHLVNPNGADYPNPPPIVSKPSVHLVYLPFARR